MVVAKLDQVAWDALMVVFAPLIGEVMEHAGMEVLLHCN